MPFVKITKKEQVGFFISHILVAECATRNFRHGRQDSNDDGSYGYYKKYNSWNRDVNEEW